MATVGKKTAQICLRAGANDFGSIMIEENVVVPQVHRIDLPTGQCRMPYVKRVLNHNFVTSNMIGGKFRRL